MQTERFRASGWPFHLKMSWHCMHRVTGDGGKCNSGGGGWQESEKLWRGEGVPVRNMLWLTGKGRWQEDRSHRAEIHKVQLVAHGQLCFIAYLINGKYLHILNSEKKIFREIFFLLNEFLLWIIDLEDQHFLTPCDSHEMALIVIISICIPGWQHICKKKL